jgi:hypothetical protein
MAFTEEKQFKYPSEDECLVRRLGSGVIAAWPHLPREVQEKIFAEAKMAWDREHTVSKLPDKMTAIIKRRHS